MPLIQIDLTPQEDTIVYGVKAMKKLKSKEQAIRHIIKEYKEKMQ